MYQILNERHHSLFHNTLVERHPFFCSLLTILVCWLPHIVFSYPCYGVYGTWSTLDQAYGISKFTGHLPLVYTLLIGYIVKLSEHFGNCNIGLFSFIVFQTAVFAVILAYMIYTLKIQLKSPEWLLAFIIVGAVFVPYYSGYLGVILRDNLYSYTVLLFVVELLYILLWKVKFFDCTRHCLLLGLAVCGSVWFRKNGIYMVFPTIMLFSIYYAASQKAK